MTDEEIKIFKLALRDNAPLSLKIKARQILSVKELMNSHKKIK